MHTDPRSAHLIDSNCPKQMGCKRMSTLHHHCTGAWCPACPPPGLQRSKVTLSSHTCFFVMACSTISNSFRGRQRALVQVSGWERPFLCCVGEGKGVLFYHWTTGRGEVTFRVGQHLSPCWWEQPPEFWLRMEGKRRVKKRGNAILKSPLCRS